MIIGVPKEIKDNENRVAITPAGVQAMVNHGHEVFIQKDAGVGSGINDEDYIAVGAKILDTPKEIFAAADMIMKVKEPLPEEYPLFKEGQILFTYLHLAPEPELTRALLEKKVVGIAYETVQLPNGALPLLTPMSEVAGRMAVQIGAQFLEKPKGGMGVLLGGVPGVPPAEVVIIGGGVVGTNAAKMAIGLGAQVTIIDLSAERLRYLDDIFGGRVKTLKSNTFNIAEAVKQADLLIGAVLIPGAKCPHLVTEEMVKTMKKGAVIVDVAIDQGGSIETIDRVTTHSNPVFEKHGVMHYSVANIPGAVARTSTFALTNVTIPYALKLANKGYLKAVQEDPALAKGVNVIDGRCTYKAVAEAHNVPYTPLEQVLSEL
uniref:alanine dehydrogenase n=1 Tax=Desulforadius tongensis TaxID=1216062 RepID=UPI00195A75A4|nr:alanine dehydrogenase [Desulforadius tongensis]